MTDHAMAAGSKIDFVAPGQEPPAWVGTRVARPAADLERSVAFYRDVIGLRHTGGFNDHDGFAGAFFALPGGGELELTCGSVQPDGGTVEDLLVLYAGAVDAIETVADRLLAAGAEPIPAENPYWTRWGRTYLDPDGYRVVIATRDRSELPVQIEWHVGSRAELHDLFVEAENSAERLAAYLELGRVLVARRDQAPIGHLQLVPTAEPDAIEINSLAIAPTERRNGVGRALIAEATRRCAAEGWARVFVATAAADVGNLRFYQRVGFRLASVEPDAFTPATGYPEPIFIDGILLRDRVWLMQNLSQQGI